jgi:hypothetical protein
MRVWSDYSEDERQILMLASEESMLWEVCTYLEPDRARRGTGVIASAQDVVGRLARAGLVWFFPLAPGPGRPPLTEAEGQGLFEQPLAWVHDDLGEVANVALYLTPQGERLYYAA